MLRIFDRTLGSPEENLAFDDGLLEGCQETLRFWESPVHFVVLGRSGRLEKEVNVAACRAAGIPVLRRLSGGGTVLQGPGCLNFALALSLARARALSNVPMSYRILLSRIAHALGLPGLEVRGTDILLEGRKVSGNAQRRTRGWLFHHGTILHGLDVGLMERLLLEPPRQPAHRGGRTHKQFLTALPITTHDIKQSIVLSFSAFSECQASASDPCMGNRSISDDYTSIECHWAGDKLRHRLCRDLAWASSEYFGSASHTKG